MSERPAKSFENSGQAHDADIDEIYGTGDAQAADETPTDEPEVETSENP